MFNFSEKILKNKKVVLVMAVVLSTTGIAVASHSIKDSPETPQLIESISPSPNPMVESTKEALILPSPSPVVQTRPKSPPSPLPSPSLSPQSPPTPTTPTPAVEGTTIAKSEKELRREKLTQLAQQPDWCPAKEWYRPEDIPTNHVCPTEPNPTAIAFHQCMGWVTPYKAKYSGSSEDQQDLCAKDVGL